MIKNNTIAAYSVGSSIITKILNFIEEQPNAKVLETIDIYGSSNRDGSAVVTLEWMGDIPAKPILDCFEKIKGIVIDSKKEVKEQSAPVLIKFKSMNRVTYTFRIWNTDGKYEVMEKKVVPR